MPTISVTFSSRTIVADGLEVERIGVGDQGHAIHQGHPEVGGLPEYMEIWEIGQKDIVAVQVKGLFQAFIVGADVAMGQLHRLGILFAAGGEQDEQGVVLVALVDGAQQPLGGHAGLQGGLDLVEDAARFS